MFVYIRSLTLENTLLANSNSFYPQSLSFNEVAGCTKKTYNDSVHINKQAFKLKRDPLSGFIWRPANIQLRFAWFKSPKPFPCQTFPPVKPCPIKELK